jgi:hypothetical protein
MKSAQLCNYFIVRQVFAKCLNNLTLCEQQVFSIALFHALLDTLFTQIACVTQAKLRRLWKPWESGGGLPHANLCFPILLNCTARI